MGAGGLGSPVALYLAAAGVGEIGIVDDDAVSLSNLQRQILFATKDVGRPKVEAAAERLAALNPGVRVMPHHTRLTAANAESLIAGYDIVADGSDNFETRFLLNDVCHRVKENPGLGGGDGIRRSARHLQGLGQKRRLSLLSLPVFRAAAARHRAQLFGDRRVWAPPRA